MPRSQKNGTPEGISGGRRGLRSSNHQYFRRLKYLENEDETDEDKASKFVYAMCIVTKNNLMPFFQKWGLNVDAPTAGKIKALNLSFPLNDPAKIFQ